MTYLELARKIKSAYKELKQDEVYKLFNIIWNNDLGESEITVENDAGFRRTEKIFFRNNFKYVETMIS